MSPHHPVPRLPDHVLPCSTLSYRGRTENADAFGRAARHSRAVAAMTQAAQTMSTILTLMCERWFGRVRRPGRPSLKGGTCPTRRRPANARAEAWRRARTRDAGGPLPPTGCCTRARLLRQCPFARGATLTVRVIRPLGRPRSCARADFLRTCRPRARRPSPITYEFGQRRQSCASSAAASARRAARWVGYLAALVPSYRTWHRGAARVRHGLCARRPPWSFRTRRARAAHAPARTRSRRGSW